MLLLRLRAEAKEGADMAQMMYEDFQEDVEMRVRASGVKVCHCFPTIDLSQTLKDTVQLVLCTTPLSVWMHSYVEQTFGLCLNGF